MPIAHDHLAEIRKAVGSVLRRHGFRARSRREWVRGDDEIGWIVVTWWGDRWNTKSEAEAMLAATVWPAGTREHLSEMYQCEVEAVGGDGPLFSAGQPVMTGKAGADTFKVTAATPAHELAAMVADAEEFADTLAQWAESMLDARISAPLMRHDRAVAALVARHPDDPQLDARLDELTATFQRDPRPIFLGTIITRWRGERGLPEVPMPPWSRYASRRTYPADRIASPRDALLAGLGTAVPFDFVDGRSRMPEPDDVPDVVTLDRWREELRRSPLPSGVLRELPEWLPYATWLEDPEPTPEARPEPAASPDPVPESARRRWWRR